jgi:hypothetical protein
MAAGTQVNLREDGLVEDRYDLGIWKSKLLGMYTNGDFSKIRVELKWIIFSWICILKFLWLSYVTE